MILNPAGNSTQQLTVRHVLRKVRKWSDLEHWKINDTQTVHTPVNIYNLHREQNRQTVL